MKSKFSTGLEKPPSMSVPAPPSKTSIGPAPTPERAANNMKDERLAPMTFNMPVDWHKRFKMTATQEGISMKELLFEAFEAWEHKKAR